MHIFLVYEWLIHSGAHLMGYQRQAGQSIMHARVRMHLSDCQLEMPCPAASVCPGLFQTCIGNAYCVQSSNRHLLWT